MPAISAKSFCDPDSALQRFRTFPSTLFHKALLYSRSRGWMGETPSNRNLKDSGRYVMKKGLGIGIVVLVGILIVGATSAWALPLQTEAANGAGQNAGRGQGQAGWTEQAPRGELGSLGDLSDSEVEALHMALDDEYKAWSVYDQVIADFGPVWPFTSIQQAEENHIAALVRLFDRYGLDVPANPWPGSVPTYTTVTAACEAGVQAEIDNAALYDQIFGMVDNPDIVRVFTNLQQASLTKHLPAFEQCSVQEPSGKCLSFLPVLSQ